MWHPKPPHLGETYGLQDMCCVKAQSKHNSLTALGDIRVSKAYSANREVEHRLAVLPLWPAASRGTVFPEAAVRAIPYRTQWWTAQQWACWRGRGQAPGIPGMSQTLIYCVCDSNWNRETKSMKECLMTDPEGP